MAFGMNINSHYFNDMKRQEFSSTVDFLQRHMPSNEMLNVEEDKTVHVFFHQYRNMNRCKPSMHNHFATFLNFYPAHQEQK
jgi:hypothetical protein